MVRDGILGRVQEIFRVISGKNHDAYLKSTLVRYCQSLLMPRALAITRNFSEPVVDQSDIPNLIFSEATVPLWGKLEVFPLILDNSCYDITFPVES